MTPDPNIFPAKRYTTEHETVSYDDETGLGTITITEHAQSSLGDVVFVELPALETKVAQGGELYLRTYAQRKGEPQFIFSQILDQIGAVESVKAASDIVGFHRLECCMGRMLIYPDSFPVRARIRYNQEGEREAKRSTWPT